MSFFDESLQGMNPEALRESISQMKQDVEQDVKDDLYTAEEAEFIQAAIDNLAEEIKGVTSFETLQIKQKARIIAFMSFIYDILEEGGDFEDDDELFDDEDFDDEDEDDSKPKDTNSKKIQSFQE